MIVALTASHDKLTALKKHNAELELDIRFESGCISSLKRLLGHSTLLCAKPLDRIKNHSTPLQNDIECKDMTMRLCITVHLRIHKEKEIYNSLNKKLKDLRSEREVLEHKYYDQIQE